MLKALYSLPEDEHFGSSRPESEREFLKKYLSKALSVTKYRQSFKDGEQFKNKINLATLLIKKLGSTSNEFNDMYASADHVIRTALLSLAYGAKKVTANKRTSARFPGAHMASTQ